MADDRTRDGRRGSGDDATVQIPAELLSLLPPPDTTSVAPPPPPPGPAAPPPPPAADPTPQPPPPPRAPIDDERRGGAIWLIAALLVVVLFVAVCYLVVAQAEDDRPRTATPTDTTEAPADTTAPSTTAPTPSTQDPAALSVVVLNGTSQVGWAGENVTRLEEAGYTGEASDAAEEVETTTVYISDESFRADGTAVATAVGLPDAPVEIRPDTPLGVTEAADTADVVVLLGADSTG